LGHRFELGGDLRVDTVEIVEARVESGAKNSHLDLKLRRRDGEAGRWPDPFSVFLHGDAAVVWSLRHALTRKVSRIEVSGPSGWVEASSVRVAKASSPGYAGDPCLHPLADARDFLCCDARFRFVEVAGLGALADGSELSLRIHFDGIFPRSEAKGVRADVFRPNAGLVVNRFSATCDGMVWDHTRSEMPLRPGKSREILDVVGVEGVVRGDPAGRIRYARFPRRDGRTDFGTFFQVRRAADPRERETVLLALGREDLDDPLQERCVVVEAICCDGDRPHENGAVGELSSVDPGAAPGVRMAGLTRPTPAYRPRSEVFERLMALAGGHFEGFLDADRLREALDLFLWDRTEVKRTLVDSIQSVVVESGYAVEHGVTLPQFRVKIQLRDTACTADAWDRLGLLDAFSDVLALLAADEAPLGAITRLDVAIEPCGIVLESSRA
jgi:type VI protein secretion system component VasA